MIKIKKDGNIHVVSKGAFENFFAPLGYEIIDEKPSEKNIKMDAAAKVAEIKKDEDDKKDDLKKVKKD